MVFVDMRTDNIFIFSFQHLMPYWNSVQKRNGIYPEVFWIVLLRYSDQLSEDELEEIIGGIEDGLSEQQIKEYFALQDAGKMNQYRRMFRSVNKWI